MVGPLEVSLPVRDERAGPVELKDKLSRVLALLNFRDDVGKAPRHELEPADGIFESLDRAIESTDQRLVGGVGPDQLVQVCEPANDVDVEEVVQSDAQLQLFNDQTQDSGT